MAPTFSSNIINSSDLHLSNRYSSDRSQSLGQDDRINQLLKQAKNQNPTKLDFIEDHDDTESFLDSSENGSSVYLAGSFNNFDGPSLDYQRHMSNDVSPRNDQTLPSGHDGGPSSEALSKGPGNIANFAKFRKMLHSEF
mmetsp:Transcript_11890/g.15143  ORF Transcript_11890/g.15143 Transcript_11890/m.15143 type:complete len:139 (+) Transcript_11890:1581-1997(+)